MKTFKLISFIALIFAFNSCVINMQDSISGNGHVVSQTRNVGEFSGIKAGGGLIVELTQGEAGKIVVEADENLQDWIRTEVNGDELHIYTDRNIRNARSKKVHVMCKTLDKIDISSAADVVAKIPFKADNLEIEISSAGELHFEVEANEVDISISSAGTANIKGQTKLLNADLSSAGKLRAFDLEAKNADVSVSSAASADIFVTDEARFKTNSAGDINYKGEPRIRNIQTSSGGSVRKK